MKRRSRQKGAPIAKQAVGTKLRSDQFLGLEDVNDGDEIAEGGSPKAPSP
jgi:hypothetical protein